jgi:hypothetical protein
MLQHEGDEREKRETDFSSLRSRIFLFFLPFCAFSSGREERTREEEEEEYYQLSGKLD